MSAVLVETGGSDEDHNRRWLGKIKKHNVIPNHFFFFNSAHQKKSLLPFPVKSCFHIFLKLWNSTLEKAVKLMKNGTASAAGVRWHTSWVANTHHTHSQFMIYNNSAQMRGIITCSISQTQKKSFSPFSLCPSIHRGKLLCKKYIICTTYYTWLARTFFFHCFVFDFGFHVLVLCICICVCKYVYA